jgi:hypothetical protein
VVLLHILEQEHSQLVASASAGTIACNGGTTTVTVSATGGTAPYTGTGTFTVAAGTHTYTVTDNNGCSTTASVTIGQPTAALSASATGADVLCYGGTTTVTVSASGGTAPYSGTGTFTVAAGTHTYTVTDANNCSTTASVTIGQPAAAISFTATATQPKCFGEKGSVVLSTATGGTGTINFNSTATTNLEAGDYTYTATDANGCSKSITVKINAAPSLLTASSSAPVLVCPTGTVEVTVSATGGTVSYNGVGTFIRGAGTHNFTVTDANGCTASTSITITATNVAPVITPIIPSTYSPVAIGTEVSVTVNYTDNNVESASLNWDDGSANQTIT